MSINGFDSNVYHMVKKLLLAEARSITIKTREATIVFKIERGALVGRIYRHEGLWQVWMHGKNSVSELMAMFESLGICAYDLVKQLIPSIFRKKRVPLLVHLKSTTD